MKRYKIIINKNDNFMEKSSCPLRTVQAKINKCYYGGRGWGRQRETEMGRDRDRKEREDRDRERIETVIETEEREKEESDKIRNRKIER